MSPRALLGAAAIVVALVGAPARADDADDALACVRTKVWEAYGQGWSLRALTSASLPLGGRKAVALSLVPGRTYEVLGCATGAVVDLDLVLFDAEGKVVRADTTTDAQPVLDLSGRTGAHTLVLYARRTSGATAGGVAAAVLHR